MLKRIFRYSMRCALLITSGLLLISGCAGGNDTSSAAPTALPSATDTPTPTSVVTATPTPKAPVLSTKDITELDADRDYRATAEEVFSFKSQYAGYSTVQGGYFNGDNFYIAMVKRNSDGSELVRILQLDFDGEYLRESEPLPLDHANCITYNDAEDVLVVSHCQAPEGHYERFSLVDPSDFSILETKDLEYPFFAMAYSPERGQYASGEWGGQTLDIWDGDFRNIGHVDVECPGSLSQGVFCDGNAVYFVRSSQNGYSSEIRVYDWDCNLLRTIPLTLTDSIEPESINIADGETYVIGNNWKTGRGTAFVLTYTAVEETQ